jgi:myo-inositol 2-dehydrogenase/D-chiro-inositol 1-dehydrogenase
MRMVVLGSGRMGRLRAGFLASSSEVDEVVLASASGDRAAQAASEVGGVKGVDFETALGMSADAFVVSTDTPRHGELLDELLGRDTPILCEKPLTDDIARTAAVAERARRSGAVLQVGYHRRFDQGFMGIREAVASGALGRVLSAGLVAFDHRLPRPEFLAGSGGIFLDMHVHDFDLLRWLTGEEVVSLSAVGSVVTSPMFAEHHDFDVTVISGHLASGALFSIRGSRYSARGQDVRVELAGSEDTLQAGLSARSPLRSTDAGPELFSGPAFEDFMERFRDAFRRETAAFVDVVAGRRANPCPPEEDLAAARIALACERSVASGRAVQLEEVERG